MFAGASGIGKSTLAKWLELESNDLNDMEPIKFISGSVSDLIPKTKEVKHEDMLKRDPKELLMEDYQVINLRQKLFNDKDYFVSDRSFLDPAGYFLYKQAAKIPACEMEQFLEICKMLLNKNCDKLIFLHLTPDQLKDWITEDNNKRITSNYFQVLISAIMDNIISIWEADYLYKIDRLKSGLLKSSTMLEHGAYRLELKSPYGKTEILKIEELNLDIRKQLILDFICQK